MKELPPLAGMVLLSRSRLSVQPVREEEWSFILRLAGMSVDAGGQPVDSATPAEG